jgi:hypothetical protein
MARLDTVGGDLDGIVLPIGDVVVEGRASTSGEHGGEA